MKTLTINKHTYEIGDKRVQAMFELVVADCEKKKINMIYAIRKGSHTDMVKLIYEDKGEMELEVHKFKKAGFKVFRCSFGA